MSALLIAGLHLTAQTDADGSAFGLTGDYYARWSIFPVLLILYGLTALHRHQANGYGRLGRIGFLTTFSGYFLLVTGRVWWEVLFPVTHPLAFVGGNLILLGQLVAIGGWGLWGIASLKAASLPTWAIPAPFVIAFAWLTGRFYVSDFLFELFWMGDVGLTYAVNAVGLGLLGLVVWRSEGSASRPASVDAIPTHSGSTILGVRV